MTVIICTLLDAPVLGNGQQEYTGRHMRVLGAKSNAMQWRTWSAPTPLSGA